MLQDLLYALRMMRKNLGSTIVIVLSLAIGIGSNSAIFSVVDALLLRPLPYPEPDRLAAIWIHSPGIGILRDWPSPGQYSDLLAESHSFEEISISRLTTFTMTGLDQPQRVDLCIARSGRRQPGEARDIDECSNPAACHHQHLCQRRLQSDQQLRNHRCSRRCLHH